MMMMIDDDDDCNINWEVTINIIDNYNYITNKHIV